MPVRWLTSRYWFRNSSITSRLAVSLTASHACAAAAYVVPPAGPVSCVTTVGASVYPRASLTGLGSLSALGAVADNQRHTLFRLGHGRCCANILG
jgi:hypothetical protein